MTVGPPQYRPKPDDTLYVKMNQTLPAFVFDAGATDLKTIERILFNVICESPTGERNTLVGDALNSPPYSQKSRDEVMIAAAKNWEAIMDLNDTVPHVYYEGPPPDWQPATMMGPPPPLAAPLPVPPPEPVEQIPPSPNGQEPSPAPSE
jgi:hypothetical protein